MIFPFKGLKSNALVYNPLRKDLQTLLFPESSENIVDDLMNENTHNLPCKNRPVATRRDGGFFRTKKMPKNPEKMKNCLHKDLLVLFRGNPSLFA